MTKINLIIASLAAIGLIAGLIVGWLIKRRRTGSSSSETDKSKPCSPSGETKKSKPVGITMTLEPKDKVVVSLKGETAVIDWGDGSPVETATLNLKADVKLEHTYDQTQTYTLKITGETITDFTCVKAGITNLDINLPAIIRVNCYWNKLSDLDMSDCPELKMLNCEGNKELKNLNVNKNSKLEDLKFSNDQLTTLDVSKNTALKHLYCSNNQLTSLDTSNNPELVFLWCEDNKLTNLNISANTKLMSLQCHRNQLTTLDVSKNSAMTSFFCGHNQLTSLDVSNNTKLTSLHCNNNQLTELDMTNQNKITTIDCQSNQLSADALNNLFNTIQDNPGAGNKNIYYRSNPGTDACDKNIIEQKGWTVK